MVDRREEAGLRRRLVTTSLKRTPLSVNWCPRSTDEDRPLHSLTGVVFIVDCRTVALKVGCSTFAVAIHLPWGSLTGWGGVRKMKRPDRRAFSNDRRRIKPEPRAFPQ